MKKLILLVGLVLALPGLALAGEEAVPSDTMTEPAPASCQGTVAAVESVDLPAGVERVESQGACCKAKQKQCEAACARTGVWEFSCDPSSCQSSCICNIG